MAAISSREIPILTFDWDRAAADEIDPADLDSLMAAAHSGSTTVFYRHIRKTRAARSDHDLREALYRWMPQEMRSEHLIQRYLIAQGRSLSVQRKSSPTAGQVIQRRLRDWLMVQSVGSFDLAVHLYWQAINEYARFALYQRIMKRYPHEALGVMLRMISDQEREHFLFLFEKGESLTSKSSRIRFTVRQFTRFLWRLNGLGVNRPELQHSLLHGMTVVQAQNMDSYLDRYPPLKGLHLFRNAYQRWQWE